MVIDMQSAVSVSFFRPELSEFLYAPIDSGTNDMPLSVLSALARLNMDPWSEAAELSALPRDGAAQRLAKLIARLPDTRRKEDDCRAEAQRLVSLLPLVQQSDRTGWNAGATHLEALRSVPGGRLLLLALAILFLIVTARGGLSF
jgi:hypothetical protein